MVKKIIYNAITALAFAGLLVLMYFYEPWLLPRALVTGNSLVQRWNAIILYAQGEDYQSSYLLQGIYDIPWSYSFLPDINLDAFWKEVGTWWKLLSNETNFVLTAIDGLTAWNTFLQVIMVLMVLIPILILVLQLYYSESGLTWKHKSKPLILYEKWKEKPWKRIKLEVKEYFTWIKRTFWATAWIVTMAFALALPYIVVDFLSEYFYFFLILDPVSLLDFVLIALITFQKGFEFLPLPIRIAIIYIVWRWFLAYLAQKKIEEKLIPANEKMVNDDTGVFTLILGKMRGGKTTLATAMARVLDTVYHKNCFDNMNRVSMMFPNFPWQAFEHDIDRLAKKRRIININQAASFAYRLYQKGDIKPLILYGYDTAKAKTHFYDGCCNIALDDAMAIYAESYFVYSNPGSLIASNYPIRTDDLRLDKGHLVLYDANYFRRDNKNALWENSTLSHVLMFDMLRMGKKIDPKGKYNDCSGPMIAVATEFGKEYGNMITNQTYNAIDDGANPKNDLLDYSLKLGGHLANVWHTNMFKFIADEQRSGSLSSNLVSVAQSIFTADPKNQVEKTALRFLWLETLLMDLLIKARDEFNKKYRHEREDKTLMYQLINGLGSWAYKMETNLFMRYGYKQVDLPKCSCDASGNLIEGEKSRFYILNYVDYSQRFESACMKDFLNAKKDDAIRGFHDIPRYKDLMPTKAEWDSQGSYLVKDLEDPTRKFGATDKAQAKKLKKGRRAGASSTRHGGANRG